MISSLLSAVSIRFFALTRYALPGSFGLLLLSALAGAVCPAETQILQGWALDAADGRVLAYAEVAILPTEGEAPLQSALASQDGFFRFELPQPGAYRLRAALLGYATVTTTPLVVENLQVRTVELRMDRDVIVLDPLTVVAERMEPALMVEVRRRQRLGQGTFILREELDERAGSRLQDLLAVPGGLTVSYHTLRGRGDEETIPVLVPLVTARHAGFRDCFSSIWVNGAPVFTADQLLDGRAFGALERTYDAFALRPDEIEAIEIYRGAATVPGEFGGSAGQCGVVAIWTRRGGVEWRTGDEIRIFAPAPQFRISLGAARSRLSGFWAPEDGTKIEGAFHLHPTSIAGTSVFLALGRYTLPQEVMSSLGRPGPGVEHQAAPARLTLISFGFEPRLALPEVGPLRPALTARGFLNARTLTVHHTSEARRHWSKGWGVGVGASTEVALTGRLAIEIAYGRIWHSLRPFPELEELWRRTSSRWSGSDLRLGISASL